MASFSTPTTSTDGTLLTDTMWNTYVRDNTSVLYSTVRPIATSGILVSKPAAGGTQTNIYATAATFTAVSGETYLIRWTVIDTGTTAFSLAFSGATGSVTAYVGYQGGQYGTFAGERYWTSPVSGSVSINMNISPAGAATTAYVTADSPSYGGMQDRLRVYGPVL